MKTRVRGFDFAYEDTGGSAAPLLLVHGFPLDRTLWAGQVRALADVARVVAPDLRGFGESGMPHDGGAISIETYADDLSGLLDALGVKSAVVAGLSMGGYVTFAFHRKNAHRVRGLILASTKAGPDSPEGKKGRDENVALARAQGAAAVGDKMMPRLLAEKTVSEHPDVANAARAMTARQSVDGVVAALQAMRDRPDSTSTLSEITAPTLVIAGDEDSLIPPKESEAMRDRIKGARYVSIPGAAHLSNLDQPDAFNHAVREFVRSLA